MSGRGSGGALAVWGALALVAVAPASARAAVVGVEGTQVVFQAAPGEVNHPRFALRTASTPGLSEIAVSESSGGAPVTPGAGCGLGPFDEPVCTVPTTAAPLVVRLGDGNDGTTFGSYLFPTGHPPATVQVFGEEGNDELQLTLPEGTPWRIVADGGPGEDLLFLPAQGSGHVLSGGPGTDTLRMDGIADFPSSVSLDGQANDGMASQGINVMPDIENVDANTGPRGSVHLIGSDADNRLLGGGGTSGDVLEGRGGDDTLMGISGDNRLIGGPGRDNLTGGKGNDEIDARDGERDAVQCGIASADTALVDELDVVSADCERVVVHLPKVRSKKLNASKGSVKIGVACPAGGEFGPPCKGKLRLRTATRVSFGGRRAKLVLAKGSYKVNPGERRNAKAKLTGKGRRFLARGRRLRAQVQLRTAAGTTVKRKLVVRARSSRVRTGAAHSRDDARAGGPGRCPARAARDEPGKRRRGAAVERAPLRVSLALPARRQRMALLRTTRRTCSTSPGSTRTRFLSGSQYRPSTLAATA
jgi:hypothetical protein